MLKQCLKHGKGTENEFLTIVWINKYMMNLYLKNLKVYLLKHLCIFSIGKNNTVG